MHPRPTAVFIVLSCPLPCLLVKSSDSSVRVWDPRTGDCEMKFATHEAPVNQVRFFPTADALGTASSDGTVSTLHPTHFPTPPTPPHSSLSAHIQCRLFDMRAGQEITIFSNCAIVLSAATLDFAKSGRLLFVGYNDNTIRVWDVLKVGPRGKCPSQWLCGTVAIAGARCCD